MSVDPDEATTSALVEVSPGTALVFGEVPDGFELVPFSLVSPEDRAAIVDAIAATSSILNVGGQLANGLAQAQGLVRLAPETVRAMQAGATPIQSGGYNIGVLAAQNGKFAAQVRWLPATGAGAVGVLASMGPAIAMIAIQIQLHELSGLVRQNLALTETVLKTVRHEQWAELTGLEQSVTRALEEAESVGHVTEGVWENISGYEAGLRKQRDLFRRHVEAHSSELAKRKGHHERRQYIEKNGEAVLLDLHSLLLAHKAWFEYQALRAGRARIKAADDPHEEKLLQTIIDNAKVEYTETVEQMSAVLDSLSRELWILAELPGKRTIPFTGARRSARDVAAMAEQLLVAVGRMSTSVQARPVALVEPNTCHVDEAEALEQDLRILRWHLNADEALHAIATAQERGAGVVLPAVPQPRVLVALTQERVLVAELSEFRKHGILRRAVPNEEIRYVRFREDDGAGRAEIDLITKHDNFTWRFGKESASEGSVRGVGALLADRMDIPAGERDALRADLPSLTSASPGLDRMEQIEPIE